MSRTHPRLENLLAVSGAIIETAVIASRAARKQIRKANRASRGLTLRPGDDTPLWNALVQALRGQLVRYGDQARLARYLGMSRQRLNTMLTGRRSLPDAERTLMLMQWLEATRRGLDLSL